MCAVSKLSVAHGGQKKKSPHFVRREDSQLLAAAYFPHPVAQAVSLALRRFTSVFEMGTGGATPRCHQKTVSV